MAVSSKAYNLAASSVCAVSFFYCSTRDIKLDCPNVGPRFYFGASAVASEFCFGTWAESDDVYIIISSKYPGNDFSPLPILAPMINSPFASSTVLLIFSGVFTI